MLGAKAERLYEAWVVEDLEGKKEMEMVAAALVLRHVHHRAREPAVLLPPPPAGVLDGPFRLGEVAYQGRTFGGFGLHEHEVPKHVLIGGMTGSGKSTLLALVILEHLRIGRPVWIYDFKRDYRALLTRQDASRLRVLTVGREVAPFSFNPLTPPPGVHAEHWDHVIVESMTHSYFLGDGAESLLYAGLESARRDVRTRAPTLQDVLLRVQTLALRGRAAQWQDSTLRALASLCRGTIGRALNTAAPDDLTGLLEEAVVFEMDALDTPTRTFMAQVLVMWVLHYRNVRNERGVWRLSIITDEAHSLFLARTQGMSRRETHLDLALRTARDSGTSLWLADQCPSLLSRVALGNTYTTIGLHLKYREDVRAMSDALLLNEKEDRDVLARLPPGHAVCRLAGRHYRPFQFRYPDLPLNKTQITDTYIAQQPPFRTPSAPSTPDPPPSALPTPEQPSFPTDKYSDASRLLADIRASPLDPLTTRYSRLRFPPRRGMNALTELLDHRCIVKGTIALRITRQVILLPAELVDSREGPEHAYWSLHMKALLERDGWNVEREAPLEIGRVDLLASKNGKRVPVEIETGKSDWKANVNKVVGAGFVEMVIVSTRTPVFESILAEASSFPIRILHVNAQTGKTTTTGGEQP
ncbi:MAG: DUF87 domain-containing protein [Deltaproteobacteria bacterium]|nr:DUF87 domain-containing protein [Deltaproteobacteria bacterium]